MRRLFVTCVYSAGVRNSSWFKLQRRFLESTMLPGQFETAYCLAGCDPSDFPGRVVGLLDPDGDDPSVQRARLLRAALQHAVKQSGFDDFLIMDSDAFPFRTGWYERLVEVMRAEDEWPERGYAALARVEAAEVHPNPSVLFVRGEFLRSLASPLSFFDFAPAEARTLDGRRLAGRVGPGIKTSDGDCPCWFPLLRTNVTNGHPIVGGLYGGLFYHHNAGTRPAEFDAVSAKLYDAAMSRLRNADADNFLFEELRQDPELLLRKLFGYMEGTL